MQIHLNDLRFFAYHGLYAEEKQLGNYFELNIDIQYTPIHLPITDINDTVNYAAVYELVSKRMAIATPLLETVVSEIAMQILAQFSLVEVVTISLYKLHPPIPHFEGKVGVSFTLNRD